MLYFNKYKTIQKAIGKKSGALGHCYSLLILLLWFNQFKKNAKSKGFSFSGTVNFWMLSVANKIDSALHIGFSIYRVGLIVVKLLGSLLTPLSIPH